MSGGGDMLVPLSCSGGDGMVVVVVTTATCGWWWLQLKGVWY